MAHSETQHPYERLSSGTRKLVPCFLSSVYKSITFSFVTPLLAKGAARDLDDYSAMDVNPVNETIEELTDHFTRNYARSKDLYDSEEPTLSNAVVHAVLKKHSFLLLMQFLWAVVWSCSRLLGSVSIRWFLMWLKDHNAGKVPLYEGWLWAFLLLTSFLAMAISNAQCFWIGAKIGWKVKMSTTAAIHAKLLRLSSSFVSKITTGRVVNLASNDAHRLCEAFLHWPFLVIGLAETIATLILLSFVLGFVPTVSGLSCVLSLVPLESAFSKFRTNLRERASRVTDKRINFMSELISGSLAVKMLGWEDPLLEKVNGIRSEEHNLLKKMNYINVTTFTVYECIQTIMACVTFVVYRFTGDELNAPDVFFALSLFSLQRSLMGDIFGMAMRSASDLLVSTKRLDDFFRLPEVSEAMSTETRVHKCEVVMHNGNYGWYLTECEDEVREKEITITEWILTKIWKKKKIKYKLEISPVIQTLSDIRFHVKPGELVGIAGKVGSGKSSLFSALLSDMENLNTECVAWMTGSISYCAQVPWIMAATVRKNIVFENEFDEDLYNRVISCCALDVDIERFPFGDQTEIGERGINLSGGQKARLALARAAYCKADVNLLDDPLSAVDPKVGRIIFERCIGGINGLMKHSTRLLITHQKQFLPFCDRIILMDRGRIECIGTWSELADHELLKHVEKNSDDNGISDQEVDAFQHVKDQSGKLNSSAGCREGPLGELKVIENSDQIESHNPRQLVEKEGRVIGQVPIIVFWEYILHIGVVPMMLTFLAMVVNKVLCFGTEWWIAAWASTDKANQRNYKWIWVLIATTTGATLAGVIAVFSFMSLILSGSTSLHNQMAKRVIHAPLSFFHRNPSGRILNRFSKDTGVQDDELSVIAGDVLLLTLQVIGSVIIVSIALPYMIPVLVVFVFIFGRVRKYYVFTSREVRRFDATTRSSVYAVLSSHLKGLPTIRAFQKQSQFHRMFLNALDLNGSWSMAYLASSRWVAFKMDCLVTSICTLSIILAVSIANKLSEKVLGLALLYIFVASEAIPWWMRQIAELENRMTSVERNLEYTKLEQEPPRAFEGGGDAPPNWPCSGSIKYSSVSASYRPGLEPVLKQLQFVVPGGSSVGIVGRTGSGKSSLLLSLYRLIDIIEGQILIDGVDISSIGIDVLRNQLSVIPQDPVLFGGTFRSNLDPWNEFGDAELWQVLNKVHLHETVEGFGGINATVAECGENLSVGQRQLLCLARAILTDSKILALDEATANVDRNTDALIQDALHDLITTHEKTLLITAHRIDTILDCDLLLVLDGGRVVEFGSPSSLLNQADGVFRRMVDAAREAADIKSHNDQI